MQRQHPTDRLLAAIDGIHAAATGELSWSAALEGVCDFVGARAADLNVFRPETLEYVSFHPARVDPFVLKYIADYMGDVTNVNPRVSQLYLPMAEGRIVADSDIWTTEELGHMPFFADFLQPWGTYDSLNTWVRRTNDGLPWIALAVHFRKADCPPQARERKRLGLLLPHIRRAFGIAERLGRAHQSVTELQEALDRVREAVLLVDASARIIHINQAGADLLRKEEGLSRTRDDVLRLASVADQSALLAALERCCSPDTILRTSDATPVRQLVIRTGAGSLVLTVQPLSSAQRQRSRAVAVLLVQTPQVSGVDRLQPLRQAYGLTPAELQLVHGLIQGRSLREMALDQGISYETVRGHLRQVFGKTGANRQATLISLVRDTC